MAMLNLVFILISFSAEKEKTFSMFQFSMQMSWYTGGLFTTAIIFAGRYFRHMVNPGASLIALMRPASIFEKWLLAFVIISILFPLA
ncbi:hypothetical protein [Undibacterium sp. TJN19]|uniref:hypothetical protein n=1 Tax=Undibacterium sp. TJN19 TaxID=3413055 RepID=UPI003BF36F73